MKNKPVVFVGYRGDLGSLVDICELRDIEVRGILDGNFLHEQFLENIPVLGSEYDLSDKLKHLLTECDFFISSGFAGLKNPDDPEKSGDLLRLERIELLERLGAKFASLIHPTAVISKSAQIGAGTFIGALSCIGPKVIMGRHSNVHNGVGIAHDVTIGKNFSASARTTLGGGTKVGDNVYMGAWASAFEGHWKQPVTIGDNSMIQIGVICMIDIPNNTTVGLHGKMFKRYESPPLPDIIATRIARNSGN